MAVMLLSIIIGGFGIYVYGVFLTHRMAGPAYRLRNFIDGMIHGDLESNISLRDKDYFQLLATDINCLRQQWHDSILELETINKQLNEVASGEQKKLLGGSSKILSDLLKKVP
jgi:methyl-accepting chemotaxis protein